MAHADYDCCACCDRALAYGGEAKTSLCGRCAARLSLAAGRVIGTPDELVGWARSEPERAAAALREAGYDVCMYPNQTDVAIREALGQWFRWGESGPQVWLEDSV